MALWKARGKSLNKEFDFRSWHCGKARGGSLIKDLEFRSWKDFRLWHSGWQGKGARGEV